MYSTIFPTYKDYSLLGVIAIACGLTYYYMSNDIKDKDIDDDYDEV
jgi:uncharacterized membrane protein